MKILIHASLDFKQEIINCSEWIKQNTKHQIILPDLTRYQHIRDMEGRFDDFNKIKNRLTKENFANVDKCDCLLILNYTHRGYENYIGGNSFMEMVIAFYLNKPIYLINAIPENMPYTEEIKSLYPKVLNSIEEFLTLK